MKKSIILGCSHACGTELGTVEFGLDNSYPVILSKKLGYNPVNYAIQGGSNDAMFRIFESKVNELTEDDIVIACWSGYSRTEIWDEENNRWVTILPGYSTKNNVYSKYITDWIKFHVNSQTGRLNKIKNILALNFLAQSKKIKVINVDSFWPVHNFNWQPNILWPVATNFWDWGNENKFPKTENGHFSLTAHTAFADYIFNNIGP